VHYGTACGSRSALPSDLSQTLMFIRFTQNVLMPAWILVFGLGLLIAPPLDVIGSVSLLVVGIFVVPALVLIPCPAGGMGPLPPWFLLCDDQPKAR
jgi:hypothetical protein